MSDTVGARQELSVILPVRLLRQAPDVTDWTEGPFPFQLGARRTDTETRSTYFTPASARTLYGTPRRPRRWHRPVDVERDGLRLLGMEVLQTAVTSRARQALAVLHFSVEVPLLPVLRALAGRRPDGAGTPLTGPFAPATLFAGIAEAPDPEAPSTLARPYTIAFMTPTAQHVPALRTGPDGQLPGSADQWLWQLASCSTPADFPLPPEVTGRLLRDVIRISADWSALVLRQGAAFLGHRADNGEGDFFDFGARHFRSVYLDALLLGTLQRDRIDELTDELSEVFDSARIARRVAALERNIAVFRSTYWRQHLTAHGPANDLLLAYQEQHRLPARFGEILAEAADYSRLVQTQESQQISGALGVLTILGLPLGTALGILQVLDDHSVSHLLLALGLSVVVTGGALTTRYGRLVMSSLRGGSGAPGEPGGRHGS
ncbi:hypothetical protein [Streptomyces sp. B93]|uniref:hypothetical protein n=1 Tax=Streptomyces sp. B93 TaxID=2824875 RepID=UPI001FFCEAC9|nr:hypothetical protein [Streptomyces sp. B93]